MRLFTAAGLSVLMGALCSAKVFAQESADSASSTSDAPTYLMRYKFQPGEVLRWKVVHQALVRTTVSGTTQTAETRSESIKVWQVNEVVTQTGQSTFVHSVESVDMRQSVSGRQDVHFNSQTDAVAPAEFEEVAKAVAVPLSTVVLSDRGLVVKRHEERAQPNATSSQIAVPLPEKAVAINESWSLPHDASVRQKDGSTKQVKTRQDFTLTEVDRGIATIRIETVVLTPIRDPALEAQLIQHVTDGTVRFDIAAGRVIGQQTDIDKHVIGFQGEASSLHYVTRFTEELLSTGPVTASRGKSTAKSNAAASKASSPAEPAAEDRQATGAASTAGKAQPSATVAGNKAVPKTTAKPSTKQAAKPKGKTGNKPTSAQQKRR